MGSKDQLRVFFGAEEPAALAKGLKAVLVMLNDNEISVEDLLKSTSLDKLLSLCYTPDEGQLSAAIELLRYILINKNQNHRLLHLKYKPFFVEALGQQQPAVVQLALDILLSSKDHESASDFVNAETMQLVIKVICRENTGNAMRASKLLLAYVILWPQSRVSEVIRALEESYSLPTADYGVQFRLTECLMSIIDCAEERFSVSEYSANRDSVIRWIRGSVLPANKDAVDILAVMNTMILVSKMCQTESGLARMLDNQIIQEMARQYLGEEASPLISVPTIDCVATISGFSGKHTLLLAEAGVLDSMSDFVVNKDVSEYVSAATGVVAALMSSEGGSRRLLKLFGFVTFMARAALQRRLEERQYVWRGLGEGLAHAEANSDLVPLHGQIFRSISEVLVAARAELLARMGPSALRSGGQLPENPVAAGIALLTADFGQLNPDANEGMCHLLAGLALHQWAVSVVCADERLAGLIVDRSLPLDFQGRSLRFTMLGRLDASIKAHPGSAPTVVQTKVRTFLREGPYGAGAGKPEIATEGVR